MVASPFPQSARPGASVGQGTLDGYYEGIGEDQIMSEGSRSEPGKLRSSGPGLCVILDADFREHLTGEVRRIPLLRTSVNKEFDWSHLCTSDISYNLYTIIRIDERMRWATRNSV